LVPSKDAKVLAHAVRGLLLDRERMLRASLDNYEKAKTYDRNKLQRARAKFWDQFHRLVTENYQGREHLSLGMAHSALPANDKELVWLTRIWVPYQALSADVYVRDCPPPVYLRLRYTSAPLSVTCGS